MDYREVIQIDHAKERFMENENLYKRFLFQFPDRELFPDLEKYLKEKNAEEAFRVAHTMKGLAGNLSLYFFTDLLDEVVEILRAKELPSEEQCRELKERYDITVDMIRKIQNDHIVIF